MALGDQAGLAAVQAAVAQIPGLEAFLGDKVNDLHAALAQTLTDGISQAGATVLKIEDAAMDRMAAILSSERAALCNYIDSRFNGMAVRMEFANAKTPDTAAPPASA